METPNFDTCRYGLPNGDCSLKRRRAFEFDEDIDVKCPVKAYHRSDCLNYEPKTKTKIENNEDFNRILEMNTEAERRQIAAQVMCAMLARPMDFLSISECMDIENSIAKKSVAYADALIAELNKKKDEK